MFSPSLKETVRSKSAAAKDGGCGVRGSPLARTRRAPGLVPALAANTQASRSPTPRSAPLRGGAAVQGVCPGPMHRPYRTLMFRGHGSRLVGADSRRARRAAKETSAVAGGWRGAGVAEGDRGLLTDWRGHRAYRRLLNLQLRRHFDVFLSTQVTYEHQRLRSHCPHSRDTRLSWGRAARTGFSPVAQTGGRECPPATTGSAPVNSLLPATSCPQNHRSLSG